MTFIAKPLVYTELEIGGKDYFIKRALIGARSIEERDKILEEAKKNHPDANFSLKSY